MINPAFRLTTLLTTSLLLCACANNSGSISSNNTTNQCSDTTKTTDKVYGSNPLYFHYFSIEIPEDIDVDKSTIQTSFAGNQFFAYPIASQQAFTELGESRIAVFSNYKLTPEALEYERKSRDSLTVNDEDYARSHPYLNMTTALYKAHKYDDQHYSIIANPLKDLDATFNVSMYSQWYIYVPEQRQYIMTKQTMFPARLLIETDRVASGKTFLDTQIRPLNQANLNNPKHMAVGPIAWIDADSHPIIDYDLKSQQYPIQIQLETKGFTDSDKAQQEQKSKLEQLKYANDGKAQHLASGARNAVGVKGREVCYDFPASSSNKPYVWCSWATDGEPENLDRPFMYLNMYYTVSGAEADRKQATAAWEQLLGSLQRRGRS